MLIDTAIQFLQAAPNRDVPGVREGAQYGSVGSSEPIRPAELQVEASISSTTAGTASKRSTPLSQTAKPLGQFRFLDRSFTIKTPSCLVPRINELFKSICDRYDVAVVNREKVDEALTLFKQVLGVDKLTSMEISFAAWKSCLGEPRFTVSFKRETGDVKDIRVRAANIPREKRKAQKYMRDLLDACQLYLQQKEFLQRQIRADLVQLDSMSGQLQNLGKQHGLSASERRNLPKVYGAAREQFAGFPDILDLFFAHVYSLMNEINSSVHVLEARESSTDRF